ncbi:hypothetical protein F5X68DRAFT_201743 [Plectosphaerella plurivora]|uniref:Uncharacterized protein n=1 Tax=Plectosphaerella plurivora TaxID=936078 RepID=A0A9P8VF90_9PEZI|nr:hypothetical protein F5X68DRAFT_201743 [Plectosphaerella plurivora]
MDWTSQDQWGTTRPEPQPLDTHNLTMYSNRSHLLEQVPLTVSPFVSLPTSTTLSYNYKTMPSALPPSAIGISAAADGNTSPAGTDQNSTHPKPQYVVSSSGHAAHPEDIIASCRALQAHIARIQDEGERELRALEERIRERELAEKRRVAPGWLDSDARILEPERKGVPAQDLLGGGDVDMGDAGAPAQKDTDEGRELDRMFGGMNMR